MKVALPSGQLSQTRFTSVNRKAPTGMILLIFLNLDSLHGDE